MSLKLYYINVNRLVCISPTSRSQIEIELNKQVDQMWTSIGNFLPNHLSMCPVHDFGM